MTTAETGQPLGLLGRYGWRLLGSSHKRSGTELNRFCLRLKRPFWTYLPGIKLTNPFHHHWPHHAHTHILFASTRPFTRDVWC
jgi:hypothetical protein